MKRVRHLAPALALAAVLTGCSSPAQPQPSLAPAAPEVAPIGEQLVGNGLILTVNSLTLSADAEVAAANEFNPAPSAGEQYTLVNLTLEALDAPVSALSVAVTLTVGEQIFLPVPVVAPAQLHVLTVLEQGAPVTGNLTFLIPAETTADINIEFSADDRYRIAS